MNVKLVIMQLCIIITYLGWFAKGETDVALAVVVTGLLTHNVEELFWFWLGCCVAMVYLTLTQLA